MSKENQPWSNESVQLNDKGRHKFLGRARSAILAGLAGAVLVPAAACADNKPSPKEATIVTQEAMIVDELAITDPGPEFISTVESQLSRNGYKVDYIPTQDVYVDFYRELPKYNPGIIIIRSHSSYGVLSGNTVIDDDVALFTSEPYSKDLYADEQRKGELFLALFLDPRKEVYFGIGSKFVENETEGEFKKGSIVIVMGCNGLINTSLADAFFKKGVDTYFGFDGSVSAQYTDKVTGILIQHLVVEHMTPQNAIAATAQEIGPDPVYGGKLLVLQKAQ